VRKWIFIIILAVLVVAPLALIGTLLYTPAGLSMVSSQLHRLERFGVRIEGLSGTLAGTMHVDRFELDHPNVHVVVHDITSTLQVRELILQTIRVSSFTARDALVEIRDAPPSPPSTKPMRFLPSFLRIDARGVDLAGVRYVNIDGTVVDATRVRGRVRISPRNLRGRDLMIEAPQFGLTGNVRLRAGRPLGLEGRVDGQVRMDRGTEIAGSAQVSGTIDQLAIQATVLRPNVLNAEATLTRPENRWRIQGSVASPAVSLEPWMDKPPLSFRNIALNVDAKPEGIRAAGNIGVPELSGRDLTIDVQGKYAQRVLDIASADVAVNETSARLHATGTITFDGDKPTIEAKGSWTDLQWPLDRAPVVSSKQGRMTLAGELPYDYTVNARVSLPPDLLKTEAPVEGDVQARGVIAPDKIAIAEYTLNALSGSMTGSASLQFPEPRAWQLAVTATHIDPTQIHQDFGGSLSFKLDAQGQGFDKQARFDATLANLTGTLRGQPIRGAGRVQRTRNSWSAHNVQLHMGDARLAANGTLGDRVDARVTLSAGSLQTFLPDARGSVNLTATATGSAKSPHVIAHVRGESLGYNEWRVASITADGDVDLGGQNSSSMTLVAQSIGTPEKLIETLRITGEGVAANHRVNIDVTGVADPSYPDPHVTMRIDGRYANQSWSGTMLATDIADGRKTGEPLVMKEPANFLVAKDRLSLEQFCIALGRGQLCAEGRWQRNGPWEGEVSGYEIPIAALLPPSGAEAEYSGRIEGRVKASGAPNQAWQAEAGARIIDAAIVYKPPGAEPETLNLGNGGLSGTATNAEVKFSLGVQAFEDTFLYANGRIQRNGSNDLMNLPLTGDVRARAADANILPIFFTEIDNAAGLLTANVDVTGSLAQPEITGRIELANGAFDSYRVNLALRKLNLIANLSNSRLDFKGSGNAGEGLLNVGGDFLWDRGELHGSLALNGQNLLVADLPEYRVVASPDLRFRIDGNEIHVAGDVTVPEARIQPVNLTGAVQVSDDARYVGETPAEEAGRLHVQSEVRITMGNDVRVDAFGLQGRIVGGVGTTVRTGETAIGRGELSVADGRYEAYGQKLDIARGRLLFDASPLDDPGLDIEAQRKIEAIKVGLNVRGTLRDPRLTFFSEPSMPQTSIMSYLLVGKGIDSMQSGDPATISSAKDTLALQGGGLIASQIGRRLGLEEVGVESTTNSAGQTNSALVLGKFLSPRLFISYGISLTESINTFKLRYTVSDKWILKMEAGENQSADAEYTIER
jgi:translocation and assembly module TamB